MAMVNASRSTYKKTFKFVLGVTSGFFIIMLASCYFNLILFEIIPKIKFGMSLLGAAYLFYLAAKILGIKFGTAKTKTDATHKSSGNSFKVGFMMQFVNPKAILYGLTIISNFVTPNFSRHHELVFFSVVLATIGFLANSSWALFGASFNKIIDKYEKPFNVSMSALLIYSALTIVNVL
jgi:threonine/homoserine/homoserine lactone efflux protein